MRAWLERAGFDSRFTSLVLALVVIWAALAVATDGIFLTPRNLYNLSIQTCVTAIMACGMVYLIVARQIDLSVGSQIAFTGMVIAFVQVRWLGPEAPFAGTASIALGIAAGMALGAFQGWWTAYRGLPAFLVSRPCRRRTSASAAALADRSARGGAGCSARRHAHGSSARRSTRAVRARATTRPWPRRGPTRCGRPLNARRSSHSSP